MANPVPVLGQLIVVPSVAGAPGVADGVPFEIDPVVVFELYPDPWIVTDLVFKVTPLFQVKEPEGILIISPLEAYWL